MKSEGRHRLVFDGALRAQFGLDIWMLPLRPGAPYHRVPRNGSAIFTMCSGLGDMLCGLHRHVHMSCVNTLGPTRVFLWRALVLQAEARGTSACLKCLFVYLYTPLGHLDFCKLMQEG